MKIHLYLLLAMLFSHVSHAYAQDTQDRRALVIGVSNYLNAPLSNPVRDARAMSAVLGACGFSVNCMFDPTGEQIQKGCEAFVRSLSTNSSALIFYSGHGIEISGDNRLLGIDAKDDIRESLSMSALLAELGNATPMTKVIILDACRSAFGRRGGLAKMSAPQNTFIAYATEPGNVALDGAPNGNSPFTTALIREILVPGISIEETYRNVRKNVIELTNGKQIPWDSSSLTSPFVWRSSDGSGGALDRLLLRPDTIVQDNAHVDPRISLKVETLIAIGKKAQSAKVSVERNELWREFIARSTEIPESARNNHLFQALLATAAIDIQDVDTGYKAGKWLVDNGGLENQDPDIRTALVALNVEGWLDGPMEKIKQMATAKALGKKRREIGDIFGVYVRGDRSVTVSLENNMVVITGAFPSISNELASSIKFTFQKALPAVAPSPNETIPVQMDVDIEYRPENRKYDWAQNTHRVIMKGIRFSSPGIITLSTRNPSTWMDFEKHDANSLVGDFVRKQELPPVQLTDPPRNP